MVVVAAVAHEIVPGMSWEAAFVLGAIVGPTDPVSAAATFSRIGAPQRVRLLVEGEAMVNDGTALVAYRVALVAAVEGTFSFEHAALEFLYSAVGGVALGIAVGWLDLQIIRRQSDISLSIFFSVIAAYAAYILGEEAHVSGVLAVVAAGIFGGWNAHKAIDAGTRLSAIAFWGVMTSASRRCSSSCSGSRRRWSPTRSTSPRSRCRRVAVAGVVIAVRMLMAVGLGRVIAETLRERVASAGPACAARSRSPRRSPSTRRSTSDRRSSCSRSA